MSNGDEAGAPRFVVGGLYRHCKVGKYSDTRDTYRVERRSARFVTLKQIDHMSIRLNEPAGPQVGRVPAPVNLPPRKLAVRRCECGAECVILGHPKACALDLLWASDHSRASPSGLVRSTAVVGFEPAAPEPTT